MGDGYLRALARYVCTLWSSILARPKGTGLVLGLGANEPEQSNQAIELTASRCTAQVLDD
jgi:hypothetical protein